MTNTTFIHDYMNDLSLKAVSAESKIILFMSLWEGGQHIDPTNGKRHLPKGGYTKNLI